LNKKIMTTKDNQGIASLRPVTLDGLEKKLRIAIEKVSTESSFTDRYTDLNERSGVRSRAIIMAVLDTIFYHSFDNLSTTSDGYIEVEPKKNDPFSTLAAVRLAYQHDKNRLDNGLAAQLVLRPVSRDSVSPEQLISASRMPMLMGVLLVNLWFKEKNNNKRIFKYESHVRKFAAEKLGCTAARLKTERSYFNNGKRYTSAEYDYYNQIENCCNDPAGNKTAFDLFLPAFRALAEQAHHHATEKGQKG
jgi:hypothetical protein